MKNGYRAGSWERLAVQAVGNRIRSDSNTLRLEASRKSFWKLHFWREAVLDGGLESILLTSHVLRGRSVPLRLAAVDHRARSRLHGRDALTGHSVGRQAGEDQPPAADGLARLGVFGTLEVARR
jgi:hypothetical protein